MNLMLTLVLVIISAVPANLFPILYARRPWRSTIAGRALMTKSIGNMLLVDNALLYFAFGEYPGIWAVRILVYTAFSIGIWSMFLVLVKTPFDPGT